MKNQLFLSCSLYSEEIAISLYMEEPLLKANYIDNDLIIYEDAAYSGKIILSNQLNKGIEKIIVFLNENEIGYVDFQKEDDDIIGEIRFEENERGRQPFLLQCDLIELKIEVIYCDNTRTFFYTPYLLCVSKSEEDAENIEKMLKALLEYDDDKINKWIFQSEAEKEKQEALLEGAMRPKSYKSIIEYINFVEQIIDCYQKCSSYFGSTPKHFIAKTCDLKSYSELRKFTQKDFLWLSQNLEQLAPCEGNTAIEYGGEYYLPLKIKTEKSRIDYNIYENRIIISFLWYVLSGMKRLNLELKKTIIDEEGIYKKLRQVQVGEYKAPIITVKKIQNQYMHKIQEKINRLIKVLEQLYVLYSKCIPCELIRIDTIPRKTKIFQEIRSYKMIYDILVKWYQFGEVNLEKDKVIFRVKTMDKLFEYYSLQQILILLAEKNYQIENTESDIQFFEYNVPDKKYINEREVANTYLLKREDKAIVLYYQPVIFSQGYQNGLELYRTTGTKNGYYTPDFVLKFMEGKRADYVILDSKFSNRKNIIKYHLKECLVKYGIEIEAKENASIKMVWLLQGRVDGEKTFYYYNNSPNAKAVSNTKSYGIVSVNSRMINMQRLWNEFEKNIECI